jgi:hypothetical protein
VYKNNSSLGYNNNKNRKQKMYKGGIAVCPTVR